LARHRFALVAALALIAATTLGPAPGQTWQRDFWCVRCGDSINPVELLLNVTLFVPFGLALRVAGARWLVAIAAIVATTVSIEVLQYTVIVGRDGSLRDCLTNTAGGWLGFALMPRAEALWRADGTLSRRLAWVAALLWIVHAAMACVLFAPARTRHHYYAQIAPRLGQFDAFTGNLLSATINGVAVNSGPFSPELQAVVLHADSIAMVAVATPGHSTRRIAPIVNIADARDNEIAILAQRHASSVFQARVLAENLGFSAPAVVLDDVFPGGRSAPVQLTGTRRAFTLRLRETTAGGETRGATLTLSPALGWALWWPFDTPGSRTLRWMTLLWLVVPLAGIGFCGANRRGTFARAATPALTAAIGAHGLVPLMIRPSPVSWSQLGIALLGVIAGVVLGLRFTPQDESLGP